MHWAAHGQTAAEVIYQRVDSTKTNLGLSNYKGTKPTKQETETAKNYLTEQELNILNRTLAESLKQKPTANKGSYCIPQFVVNMNIMSII